MKILLINPVQPGFLSMGSVRSMTFEPVSLGLIAALTAPEHEVAIHDEQLDTIDYELAEADLVGITSMTANVTRAYEVADIFMKRQIPVVLGGLHVSALPQEALQHASAVVVGQADLIWRGLLSDLQKGRLQPIYRSDDEVVLDDLPHPRRDLFRKDYGHIYRPIQASRGCLRRCDFCSIHKFFGGSYRTRSVRNIIREVEAMGERYVSFLDDDIFANRAFAKELLRNMIPLNLHWYGLTTINFAKDLELLRLAEKSGCDELFIGFESTSQGSLNEATKGNKAREYSELLKRIKQRGIEIWAAFIFGFDSDTVDCFEKTLEFMEQNGLMAGQFTIQTPLPGTELYKRLD